MRFEGDRGDGFQRAFAETFSFHAARHHPSELYLQFEDLWSNPRRLAPQANRRDSEEMLVALFSALPGYLEALLERLAPEAGGNAATFGRVCEDVAVFCQVAMRFLSDKQLVDRPQLRLPALHFRRLLLRTVLRVMEARVRPEFLEAYVAGSADPDPVPSDPFDLGFFQTLAEGDPEAVDRSLVAAAELAFYRWLEDVCLDESNQAFEVDASPFEERAVEVLRACSAREELEVSRARDLTPFLRRPRNRDCQRVLKKLEVWFFRQYDVRHAGAVLHHADNLTRGRDVPDRLLSWHSRRNYLLTLTLPTLPFLVAIFFYGEVRTWIDLLASLQVLTVGAAALWFLVYRFVWRRDLTFFDAAVPRIGAGIIVGYLPVFLIDEVWDLAEQPALPLGAAVLLLGLTTLLYLYAEVQRRLRDTELAFRRAVDLFLIGVIQSAAFGLLVTSLLGPFMAVRNWGENGELLPVPVLQDALPPFLGELPRILGVFPFVAFPTAVVLMTFLAFFIGTFLQLLWEDLPITEPM